MATFQEIEARIDELKSRQGKASISPSDTFGVSELILDKTKAVDDFASSINSALAGKASKEDLQNVVSGINLLGDKANEAAVKALTTAAQYETWRAVDTGHYWKYNAVVDAGHPYNSANWLDIGVVIPGDVALRGGSDKTVAFLEQSINFTATQNHYSYGTNLFIREKAVEGYSITDTGVMVEVPGRFASEYIDVSLFVGKIIYSSVWKSAVPFNFSIFGKIGNFIRYVASVSQMTIEDEDYYIRVDGDLSLIDHLTVSTGVLEEKEFGIVMLPRNLINLEKKIVMPEYGYYAVEGQENAPIIFYENILSKGKASNYFFGTSNPDVFVPYREFLKGTLSTTGLIDFDVIMSNDYLPTPNINHIKISDLRKECKLCVAPASRGNGNTLNVLMIGDSHVQDGNMSQRIYDRGQADGMMINLKGTRGTYPALHEGRGGWSCKDYCTKSSYNSVSNPFYNQSTLQFDFVTYIAANPMSLDWIFYNSGTNEAESCTNFEIITYYNQIIDSLLNARSGLSQNYKIGIWLPILTSTLVTTKNCLNERLMQIRQLLIDLLDNDIYRGYGVYLIDAAAGLDRETGFYNNGELQIYNSLPRTFRRLDDETLGMIHPNPQGYYQLADYLFALMKYYA